MGFTERTLRRHQSLLPAANHSFVVVGAHHFGSAGEAHDSRALTRLAAAHANAEHCHGLRELLANHEAQIQAENWAQYYQEAGDWDFHYQIVELSGNARLFSLLCDDLYDLLRLYRVQTSGQPQRPERAFKEHHQIVDAIEANDGELAELLMRRHISNARQTLVRQLES